ncbi:MAG: response regulator [Polyangia bacterium]
MIADPERVGYEAQHAADSPRAIGPHQGFRNRRDRRCLAQELLHSECPPIPNRSVIRPGSQEVTVCDEGTPPWALIVEDNRIVRDVLVDWMRHLGIVAHAVADGQEALRCLQHPGESGEPRGRPCVMLVDVNMPNVDGLTLRRRLLPFPELARIPCVMMSGGHPDWEVQARSLGVVGCLQKPFAKSALREQLGPYCLQPADAVAAPT